MHWCHLYEHNQNFVPLHNDSINAKLPPYLVMNLKQYPNIYPDLMDLIHLFVFFNPESASDTEENSNVVI